MSTPTPENPPLDVSDINRLVAQKINTELMPCLREKFSSFLGAENMEEFKDKIREGVRPLTLDEDS